MRLPAVVLATIFVTAPIVVGQGLNEEQMGPWSALEEQVGLDFKQDYDGMKKFLHPKACYWGDNLPAPVSNRSNSYYEKLRKGQDKEIAFDLVPVSVVVVDDVAIVNFYVHVLTQPEDGGQVEKILRGHNTWKRENGRWLLLATYNTTVETDDD